MHAGLGGSGSDLPGHILQRHVRDHRVLGQRRRMSDTARTRC
jgi:hypothetical protein